MKSYSVLFLLLFVIMLLCPVAAVGSDEKPSRTRSSAMAVPDALQGDVINVFAHAQGNVQKVEMREYIIGAVAAEMPPTYHTEALMAQAVACYTYALRVRSGQSINPDKSLLGADISDSSGTHQGYYTQEKRKELWGDKYDAYEAKIEQAVDEVAGNVILSGSSPILAVYHSLCSGSTRSSQSLWGESIPYLQSVESPGDRLSPDFISTVKLTENEFGKKLTSLGISKLPEDASKWVGKAKKDEGDYVTDIELCGIEYSGIKVRDALGLRSCCFTINYSDGTFTVTANGHGHGAGMSQYGADYMARQGSSWREILLHYYTDVTIGTLNS